MANIVKILHVKMITQLGKGSKIVKTQPELNLTQRNSTQLKANLLN